MVKKKKKRYIIPSINKDVKTLDLHTLDGNVNWCCGLWTHCGNSSTPNHRECREWSNRLGLHTHLGEPYGGAGSWFWPGPTHVAVAIWKVNQWIKDLSLSAYVPPSLSLCFPNKDTHGKKVLTCVYPTMDWVLGSDSRLYLLANVNPWKQQSWL